MINAQFNGDQVSSNSIEAFSLYEKSRFGEKANGKIDYSFVECLYLNSIGRMKVFSGNNKIDIDELIIKFRKKDKRIEVKFLVFKDLRRRGYIIKTALKFGADFRVYQKGIKPGDEHALWILFIVKESENLKWNDFTAKTRIAHSTKKKLLLGIVDDESDVSYYEIGWAKV